MRSANAHPQKRATPNDYDYVRVQHSAAYPFTVPSHDGGTEVGTHKRSRTVPQNRAGEAVLRGYVRVRARPCVLNPTCSGLPGNSCESLSTARVLVL